MKRIAISAGISFVILFGVAAALVGFGSVRPPQTFAAITEPFATLDLSGLPPLEHYRARDGRELSFRSYRGGSAQVAVLIHGSAGSSVDMHPMARALADTGVTVYVPDLRGHGANYPHGDVSYTGQLDDDLSDFVQTMRPKLPDARWTLVGFSSGGGFALRIAGSSSGKEFDRYLLLSPFLKHDAPTARPPSQEKESHAWYDVSVKRIVGLSIFNFFGVHAFDGLPVLAFAVPLHIESVTPTYSFRMLNSFAPHPDYQADIRAVPRPMQVFVGGADELFLPEKFGQVFGAERRDIPVTILPGMGHSDMITKPEAIRAVVMAFHSEASAMQAGALPRVSLGGSRWSLAWGEVVRSARSRLAGFCGLPPFPFACAQGQDGAPGICMQADGTCRAGRRTHVRVAMRLPLVARLEWCCSIGQVALAGLLWYPPFPFACAQGQDGAPSICHAGRRTHVRVAMRLSWVARLE